MIYEFVSVNTDLSSPVISSPSPKPNVMTILYDSVSSSTDKENLPNQFYNYIFSFNSGSTIIKVTDYIAFIFPQGFLRDETI